MSTLKQLRVALAQTCPRNAPSSSYPAAEADPLEIVRANLADAADFVRIAKEGGAEVVCFAEYYLQGILNEGRQVSATQITSGKVQGYRLMAGSICLSPLDIWKLVSLN
jgi:predicted amidohydrolase